jgi:hypothetical protein
MGTIRKARDDAERLKRRGLIVRSGMARIGASFGEAQQARVGSTATALGRSDLGRGLTALALTILLVSAIFLTTAPSASAAPPPAVLAFTFTNTIGDATLEPGSVTGIAVEESNGQVFVADQAQQSLEVFDDAAQSTDGPAATVEGILTNGREGSSITINQSTGDLYAQTFFGLRRFTSDRAPAPVLSEDSTFSAATEEPSASGFAVDPSDGSILFPEPFHSRIRRLTASGEFVSDIPAPNGVAEVVVAPDGTIYALEVTAALERISKYSPGGQLLGQIGNWSDAVPVAITFDQNDDSLLVASMPTDSRNEKTGAIDLRGFRPDGAETFSLPFPESVVFRNSNPVNQTSVKALAIDNTSGDLFAWVNAPTFRPFPEPGRKDLLLKFERAWLPGVGAPAVSDIQTDSFHLQAELDLGPEPATENEARFEYSSDNGQTWVPTAYQDDSSGRIEADVQGLSPNVNYLVRTRATNSQLSTVSSNTAARTAPVPPTVATGEAIGVGETEATLTGTVDPVGLQTGYRFEYGLSATYEASVPVGREAVAGGGHGQIAVEQTIDNLLPGATYHFRIVANNAVGPAAGQDATFTTTPAGGTLARAFEQVSPVQHNSSFVFALGTAFVGSSDDAVSYVLKTSGGEGSSSNGYGTVVASRTSAGWNARPVDPLVKAPTTFYFYSTLGLTPDLSRSFNVSNVALTPGASVADEAANLYVTNLKDGKSQFVAGSEAREALKLFTGNDGELYYKTIAPDLSWVLFFSPVSLGPNGVAEAMYKWTEGEGLSIVSRLPDNSPTPVNGGTAAASADGQVLYFGGPTGIVYVRDHGVTTAISNLEGNASEPVEAHIRGATPDGRYAFISSYAALVPGVEPLGFELLYRYDSVEEKLEYLHTDIDFSIAGTNQDITSATKVYGFGEDGQTAYFKNGLGEPTVWHAGTVQALGGSVSEGAVSANGRYFTFSRGSGRDGDVYLYSLDSGQTRCLSCVRGAPSEEAFLPGGQMVLNAPRSTPLTGDGRVFFTSSASLVPNDTNGTDDVYEYFQGQLRLVTPGDQPADATLSGITPDGSNVYFKTSQALVSQDTNRQIDMYDARVGGGIQAQNPPPPPPPCVGESCQTASSTTMAGSPAIGSEAVTPAPKPAASKARCPKPKKGKKSASCKSKRPKNHRSSKSTKKSGRHHRGKGVGAHKAGGTK